MGTHSLEHFRKAEFDGIVPAGEHGAAADKNGGQVETAGSHEHPRDNLVAVGDKYNGVERVGGKHDLDGIGNQLTGAQGVAHPFMAHGQAVAHADGFKLKRDAAGIADPGLDGLADLFQMPVPGDIFAE